MEVIKGDAGEMESIKSYVVFDLETTGLLKELPRVTEICVMTFTREQLLAAKNNENLLPRVFHQFSFCVNPTKSIHPIAAKVTGLTNEMLGNVKTFDDGVFSVLLQYIERMPQPVCLVAHNGDGFDFPILQAELSRLNKALPDSVVCADSLVLFQRHFPRGCSAISSNDQGTKKRKTAKSLKSHKLEDLHKFFVSTATLKNKHSASVDVEALAKCLVAQGNLFTIWADKNAVPFSKIVKCW